VDALDAEELGGWRSNARKKKEMGRKKSLGPADHTKRLKERKASRKGGANMARKIKSKREALVLGGKTRSGNFGAQETG